VGQMNLSRYTDYLTSEIRAREDKLALMVTNGEYHKMKAKVVFNDAVLLKNAGFVKESYKLIKYMNNNGLEIKDDLELFNIEIAYHYFNGTVESLFNIVSEKFKKYRLNFRIFEVVSDYIIENNPDDFSFLIEKLEELNLYPSYIDIVRSRAYFIKEDYEQVLALTNGSEKLVTTATLVFSDEVDELTLYALMKLDREEEAKGLIRKLDNKRFIDKHNLFVKEISDFKTRYVIVSAKKAKKQFTMKARLIFVALIVVFINIFSFTTKTEKAEQVDLHPTFKTEYKGLVKEVHQARDEFDFDLFNLLFTEDSDQTYIAERFSEITYDVNESFQESYIIDLDGALVYYNVYYLDPTFDETYNTYNNVTYNDYLVIDEEHGLFTSDELSDAQSIELLDVLYPESKGHDDFAYLFTFKSIFNPDNLEMHVFDVRSVVYDEEREIYEVYFYMYNNLVDSLRVDNTDLLMGTDPDNLEVYETYNIETYAKRGELKFFKVEIPKDKFEKFNGTDNMYDVYYSVEYYYFDQ
jgi:hypothetical protein